MWTPSATEIESTSGKAFNEQYSTARAGPPACIAALKRAESAWNVAEVIRFPFSSAAVSSNGAVAVHDANPTNTKLIIQCRMD